MDSLNVKEYDLEFAVDPLFRKMSAEFDEGGANGLLLNHLSVYGDCRLVFDSSDAAFSKQSTVFRDEQYDFNRLQSNYYNRLYRNVTMFYSFLDIKN